MYLSEGEGQHNLQTFEGRWEDFELGAGSGVEIL